MEKFNLLLNNQPAENLPLEQLPKELNQFIFSFFSKPVDLAKACIINKTWHRFNQAILINKKAKLIEQTISILADTNQARKLPINTIEQYINFLIDTDNKYKALESLQNIHCGELSRYFNNSFYHNEAAADLEHIKNLRKLLQHKFKLAGYINGDLLDLLQGAMCSQEEKFNTLVTLCTVRILLENHFESSSIQEEFALLNKYFATCGENNDMNHFYKLDGKAYLGQHLLDEIIVDFDEDNQQLIAIEAAKKWLIENDYSLAEVKPCSNHFYPHA